MALKPSLEDTLLLRRLKAGETEAHDIFVQRYKSLLEGSLRSLAAAQPSHIPQDVCAAIVDDAVSYAFSQFFVHIADIDENNNFLGFLARTAINHARDGFKQAQQRYSREKPWPSFWDADREDADRYVEPAHELPENRVLYFEAMTELERAINVLQPAQQLAIRLLAQGLSTAQIAHVLGLSEDATESLIRRARIKIVEYIVHKLQLEGLSPPQITSTFGRPNDTSKSPLRRAVEKLLGRRHRSS